MKVISCFVREATQSRFTKVNQDVNPQVMKINSSKMQKARFLPKAVQDNNPPGIEQIVLRSESMFSYIYDLL